MNAIDELRAKFSIAIIGLIWLNCALLIVRAMFITDGSTKLVVAGALAIAGGACVSWVLDRTGQATRIATSLALAGQSALLVYAFSGSPLQSDLHMYFFAMLAICA